MAYVTDEVRALIGVEGPRFTAPAPLGADELRRFVQAAMEENPVHWDADAARAGRYGEVVRWTNGALDGRRQHSGGSGRCLAGPVFTNQRDRYSTLGHSDRGGESDQPPADDDNLGAQLTCPF